MNRRICDSITQNGTLFHAILIQTAHINTLDTEVFMKGLLLAFNMDTFHLQWQKPLVSST